jgi:molecular chaperone GrpE
MSNKKKEPSPEGTGKPTEETSVYETEDSAKNPEPSAGAECAQSAEAEVLRKELAAEHDRYLRILAEYDNFRKRSAKEREFVYMDVRCDTVEKFLPVFDNLERALAQATADESSRKGIEMIMAQFTDTLSQFGVKAIEAKGQKFDPERHNAVMHTEEPSLGEGVIVEEFQKGFAMGDKIIRVSMVKVAN